MDRIYSKVSGIFSYTDLKDNPDVLRIVCHPDYSCPMSNLSQKECKVCRISIRLIDEKEIQEARKAGFVEVLDYAFACPLKVQGIMDLIKYKNSIKKTKVKAKAKAKK